MVRFINKNLKAHSYKGNEKISDLLDVSCFVELMQLLTFHTQNFASYSTEELSCLFKRLTIKEGIMRPTDFSSVFHMQHTRIKDLFLTIEIILESFHKAKSSFPVYFIDFVEDVNDLFLIHKIPLQIRYIPNKQEFFVERIISEEVSERITKTLDSISEHEKTFQDFKSSIKEFSSGNYPESIKLCCKSIEDYLCLILNKNSCQNVENYYKEASKKLKIPQDLDNRFDNLVKYIHKYRSIDSHGRLENAEVEDIELVNETIIQFTMAILYYLSKKIKVLEVKNKVKNGDKS